VKNFFYILLGIFLLLGAFAAPIMDGIKGWRTDGATVSNSFAVTTVGGQTTANVTLTRELFQDDVAEVATITSNVTGEVLIASAYTGTTQVLLLAALNPSETHTITVEYYAETESTVIRAVGPFLGVLVIGALILVIFQNSKNL